MNLSARKPQNIVFSSRHGQSFGAYHDLYASGTTVARVNGRRFGARVSAYRFPDLLLFNRSVSGASHHRDASRVRRDMFEHINLQVLRSGRMAAGSPGEERWMRPGDIVVFDTAHPQRTIVEQADYVSVAITRSEIESSLPAVGSYHGTILPTSAAGLLSDFVLTLGRHAPTLGPNLSGTATALAGKMLAEVLAQTSAAPPQRDADASDLRRWRAVAYMKANLDNPLLSPDVVAAAIGVSRTALFQAFAPVNGVARRILALRLAAFRRALERPGETRTIAQLAQACGFVEESSCYRAFKAAFSITPGQMRSAARAERDPQPSANGRTGWADWWGDIA